MRIAVKEVGKELQIVDTTEKYRMECVQKFTGENNSVDFVKLNSDGTLCLGVNEEGLLLEMPTNFLIEMGNPYFPIQKMVGTVVFVRTKYVNTWEQEIWDYEVEDLTDKDLELIKYILSGDYQVKLVKKFIDYGKGFAFINKT